MLHLGGELYVHVRDILAIIGAEPRGCVVYAREGENLLALPTELSLRAIGRRVQSLDEETRQLREMKR